MSLNTASACNKKENPFEKTIPVFRLNTENYGLRDFYDCSELHKGSFSLKNDLFSTQCGVAWFIINGTVFYR